MPLFELKYGLHLKFYQNLVYVWEKCFILMYWFFKRLYSYNDWRYCRLLMKHFFEQWGVIYIFGLFETKIYVILIDDLFGLLNINFKGLLIFILILHVQL